MLALKIAWRFSKRASAFRISTVSVKPCFLASAIGFATSISSNCVTWGTVVQEMAMRSAIFFLSADKGSVRTGPNFEKSGRSAAGRAVRFSRPAT